jgi:hypothetical protein
MKFTIISPVLIFTGLIAIGILVLSLIQSEDKLGGDQPNYTTPTPGELTFEQDGVTYLLVNGDVYEVKSNGSREFLEKLFDPDFFAKNYRIQGDKVFQVDESGNLYPVTRTFRDGFEGVTSVQDLITTTRWHVYNTDPKDIDKAYNYYDLGNRITVSQEQAHSGINSLKFYAKPSSQIPSKASINKNIMYFKKGDHVYFSGWFYVTDVPSIYDGGGFTIMDLETTFIKSIGLRIIFRQNDSLAFELEMPKTQFKQEEGSEVRFPTDGHVQIWQDGQLVLDKSGRTLPLPDTIYDKFEVGISAIAKGAQYEKIMYVDDIVISDIPIRD